MPEWVPGVDFERNYIRNGLQGCVPVWVPSAGMLKLVFLVDAGVGAGVGA